MTTFKDYLLYEYDCIIIAEMGVALRHVGLFISTMEATESVTSSLVLRITHGIRHATSKNVPDFKYVYLNGELI